MSRNMYKKLVEPDVMGSLLVQYSFVVKVLIGLLMLTCTSIVRTKPSVDESCYLDISVVLLFRTLDVDVVIFVLELANVVHV